MLDGMCASAAKLTGVPRKDMTAGFPSPSATNARMVSLVTRLARARRSG